MPLSLAALRYRSVTAPGGPLASLVDGPGELWDGRPCRHAFATLRPELRGPVRPSLYGDADGQGTAVTRSEACHRAVSEALERWAFYAASRGPEAARLGFDVEPSTTGMAAFPGVTAAAARGLARLEAIERWSLLEWWRGRLPSRSRRGPGGSAEALEVRTPFARAAVAVVWTPPATGGPGAAYGFAAGPDFATAAQKAAVELARNRRVLSERGPGAEPSLANERRLTFFASAEGHGAFLDRSRASALMPEGLPPEPPAVVDRELEGPWSRFAHVWRVLWRHEGGPDEALDDPRVFRF